MLLLLNFKTAFVAIVTAIYVVVLVLLFVRAMEAGETPTDEAANLLNSVG